MKTKQRLLRMILNKIDIDLFYNVSITYLGLALQAEFSKELSDKLDDYKFDFSIDGNGFKKFTKGCLTITLT